MHNGITTGFDVITTDNEGLGSTCDVIDTGSHGETWFNTEITRFSTRRDDTVLIGTKTDLYVLARFGKVNYGCLVRGQFLRMFKN